MILFNQRLIYSESSNVSLALEKISDGVLNQSSFFCVREVYFASGSFPSPKFGRTPGQSP